MEIILSSHRQYYIKIELPRYLDTRQVVFYLYIKRTMGKNDTQYYLTKQTKGTMVTTCKEHFKLINIQELYESFGELPVFPRPNLHTVIIFSS